MLGAWVMLLSELAGMARLCCAPPLRACVACLLELDELAMPCLGCDTWAVTAVRDATDVLAACGTLAVSAHTRLMAASLLQVTHSL